MKPIRLYILLILMAVVSCGPEEKKEDRKVNIILILADDLGYSDLGYTGCKDFKTPNIDQLAAEGVICTNGYASHSFCAPTRAGIITGRNQHRFGFQGNPKKELDDLGLPVTQLTLPQLLSKAGYKSALVGKWHLGVHPEYHPLNRGFNEFYGFLSGGHDYFKTNPNDLNKHSYSQPLEFNDSLVPVKNYLTDQLTHQGVQFIKRNDDTPFFLYMSYNAPHSPFQAPKEYLDRVSSIKDKRRRTYAAMVTALDDGVGQIMKVLKEKKLEDNTLVFFMSDNGGAPIGPANNKPFRGMKGTLLEGGIHVPYIVRWKDKLNPGIYKQPVVSYDVFETALGVAGVDIPSDRVMDGKNLIPYFLGDKKGTPHDYIYWKHADHQWAIRTEDDKILGVKNVAPYLFDLTNDKEEKYDKSHEKPKRVNELTDQFLKWNDSMPKAKYESTGIAVPKQSNALEELSETRNSSH